MSIWRLSDCLLGERCAISALGYVNNYRIVAAGACVVFVQARTQAAGFHPDRSIDVGIVGSIALKHIDSDCVFLQRTVRAVQRVIDYVSKELLPALCAREIGRTKNPLEFSANRLRRWRAARFHDRARQRARFHSASTVTYEPEGCDLRAVTSSCTEVALAFSTISSSDLAACLNEGEPNDQYSPMINRRKASLLAATLLPVSIIAVLRHAQLRQAQP